MATNRKYDKNQHLEGLVHSIVEDTDNKLLEIESVFEKELIALYQEHEQEITAFEQSQQETTTLNIQRDSEKLRNKGEILKKRLHLNELEKYIRSMTEETVLAFRTDGSGRYKEMVTDSLRYAAQKCGNDTVTIYITPGDDDLRVLVNTEFQSKHATVEIDNSIRYGGIIIKDDRNNITYNATLDRLCERKRERIRNEIYRLIINTYNELEYT